MINPVLLTNAVRAAAEDGFRLFLEVSSHPIISHSVNETLMSLDVDDTLVMPTLLRNKPAMTTLLKALANLWCKGAPIDFQSSFSGIPWASDLPKTKWRHQTYWKDIGTGSITSERCHDPDSHTLLGRRIPVAGTNSVLLTSKLDDDSRPFPGRHPLHGTEIVPAAVLFNTFLHATGSASLSDVQLRVPVAISAPRDIQVVVQERDVRIMSRLIQDQATNASWVTHTTGQYETEMSESLPWSIDVAAITARIGQELKPTFSVDYLAGVGVPDMGFPWSVLTHFGNTDEMIAKVDVCPAVRADQSLPWDALSWAPVFDSATSIGSTLFYHTPLLRMPAHVANVTIAQGAVPPKTAYIYVKDASQGNAGPASDVTIAGEDGLVLAKFTSMRFSEIEAKRKSQDDVDGLVHQLAWPPARLSETPHALDNVVLLGGGSSIVDYELQLKKRQINVNVVGSSDEIANIPTCALLTVVYVPECADSRDTVAETAESTCQTLLGLVKAVITSGKAARIFVITRGAIDGVSTSVLAHGPLIGLSRIIAAEQPTIWGGLIDTESPGFPFQAVRYVVGADVVKIDDSVARVARLRPMPAARQVTGASQLDVRPEGTYLITGGLGALGLEVADFLVERGARRLVLVSRRGVPERKNWTSVEDGLRGVIEKIQALERKGASVYTVAADMTVNTVVEDLSSKLDALDLPPVLGVVHAAGKYLFYHHLYGRAL